MPINLSEMVYQMCHTVLSAADMKAISKNRGFSERETASRSTFETRWLSSTGVEAMMKSLSTAEITALHLLSMENRVVTIAFFERLYGGGKNYGTYTQQLKPVFDAVQRNLVRKGLLVITEANTTSMTKTKMELWRFYFPPEFAPYLPRLFDDSLHTSAAGGSQEDKFRAELRQLLQDPLRGKKQYTGVELVDGQILIDKAPFSVQTVNAWRHNAWNRVVINAGFKRDHGIPVYHLSTPYIGFISDDEDAEASYHSSTPLPFIRYVFEQLAADEWLLPNALNTVLDIGYSNANHPAAEVICQLGWETNNLARHRKNGVDYYRLVDARHRPVDIPPERYLRFEDSGIFVDIDTIPERALEQISAIATLKIEARRFKVGLSLAKLVDHFESLRDLPLAAYFQEHSAEFRSLTERIAAQWGKLIVHQHVYVARITDLSLRVKLQKAFDAQDPDTPARLIVLSDEYVAFPRALIGEVEKLVKKSGHVVKYIQAK